ncbi:MAG: hypothetical protein Q3983_08155 [Capnocytophaga sp.]|nr:hypothetical protein [Capnocytophaga sp.]
MTKKIKEISIWHWKKILFLCCITSVATYLQIIWAMRGFIDSLSSVDLRDSLLDRALALSLLTLILVGVYLLRGRAWKYPFRLPIFTGLLILCWFFWDYHIFIEYEAAWSTYSRKEIIFHTLKLSFAPILVLGILFYYTLRWFLYSFFIDKK